MAFLTPSATGERGVLLAFLGQQFSQVRSSVYGLSDEQLQLTPSASEFSLAGVLHHLADVADGWGAALAAAPDEPVGGTGAAADGEHRSVQDELSGADLLARFDRSVAGLVDVVAQLDLEVDVPTPDAPWYPPDLTSWQGRWVVQHLIAEVARHAGHADIIRESIDGKISYELNARADGELADDEEFPRW